MTSGERPQLDDFRSMAHRAGDGDRAHTGSEGSHPHRCPGTRPRDYNYDPNVREGRTRIPCASAARSLLLSTFELTQAQWERLAEIVPAHSVRDTTTRKPCRSSRPIPWRASVGRSVSIISRSWGLQLLTEAQWEFAARAGDPEAPEHFYDRRHSSGSNLYQRTRSRPHQGRPWFLHGPVDRMEESAWGFLGMFGNVSSGP